MALLTRCADDGVVDFFEGRGADAFAEVNHHGGVEEVFAKVFVETEEVLEVGVFADLGDGFLVGDAEAFLDDERAKGDAAFLGGCAHAALGEVGAVVFPGKVPWDEAGEFHPAVLKVELATKREVEVGQGRLLIGAVHDYYIRSRCTVFFSDSKKSVRFFQLFLAARLVKRMFGAYSGSPIYRYVDISNLILVM